jgi:hypothetical protein
MLAVADRFEADLPVAEVNVTSTADLNRLLGPSAQGRPVRTFRYAPYEACGADRHRL